MLVPLALVQGRTDSATGRLNPWMTILLDNHSRENGNISGVNQSLRANYGNFNLCHQINVQGERRIEMGGGFAKVWLPNPMAGPDCKITQSLIPLGCWSNDSDWSFHSLHEEIGLHLIRSLYKKSKLIFSIRETLFNSRFLFLQRKRKAKRKQNKTQETIPALAQPGYEAVLNRQLHQDLKLHWVVFSSFKL